MYHLATKAKSTSENVNCTPNSVVGLIGDPVRANGVGCDSLGAEPCQCLLSIDEPLRWEDSRSLDGFRSRCGKPGGHEEREPANAGRAVPRNDVRVPPLHDARAEPVCELGRVDEEGLRSG